MSAYGDYKAGLIDDSQYTRECNEEARRNELFDLYGDEEVFEDDDIDEF